MSNWECFVLGVFESSEAKIFCKEIGRILPTSCKTPAECMKEDFCARKQGCSRGLWADELEAEENFSVGWAFAHQDVQHSS